MAQAVLLDTDVYSALFVATPDGAAKRGYPIEQWRESLLGHRVVIAFQTRAEVLVGAQSARWGAVRIAALHERLDATPTVNLDEDVLSAFVELTVSAKQQGNGIAQKPHVADRWIAACAIAKSLPLASRDTIFEDLPLVTSFPIAPRP